MSFIYLLQKYVFNFISTNKKMVKSQQASAILQKLFVILHLLVDSLFLYINKDR